jgi:hypothetical protein
MHQAASEINTYTFHFDLNAKNNNLFPVVIVQFIQRLGYWLSSIVIIIILLLLFTAIGCSPGGSRPYIDTDKESLYRKGTI